MKRDSLRQLSNYRLMVSIETIMFVINKSKTDDKVFFINLRNKVLGDIKKPMIASQVIEIIRLNDKNNKKIDLIILYIFFKSKLGQILLSKPFIDCIPTF